MVKTFRLPVLLWLIFVVGCSHTLVLNTTPPSEFYKKLNAAAKKEKGRIITLDNREIRAIEIHGTPDSIRWKDPVSHQEQIVPISSIQEITIRNHTRGGIDGIKIGVIAGGIGGSVAGPIFISSSENKDAAGFILSGIAFGILSGFVAGGIIGSPERFIFIQSKVTINQGKATGNIPYLPDDVKSSAVPGQ